MADSDIAGMLVSSELLARSSRCRSGKSRARYWSCQSASTSHGRRDASSQDTYVGRLETACSEL